MERRDTLKALICAVLALPELATAAGDGESANDALVVVVRHDSPIIALDALQIHKAFLGLDVQVEGRNLQPLINDSQTPLHDAFLQHVVGSTELNFRRRLLMLTLQHGRPAPTTFQDEDALRLALQANPFAVTYMWLAKARSLPNIRIVKVLWHR